MEIASFPDESLEVLRELGDLEWLSILHMPKVTSLSPLAGLAGLRLLSLATLPGWDASGRRTVVESLVPLAQLEKLAHLALLGVTTPSKSLRDLECCKRLRTATLLGFLRAEVARFIAATGVRDALPATVA